MFVRINQRLLIELNRSSIICYKMSSQQQQQFFQQISLCRKSIIGNHWSTNQCRSYQIEPNQSRFRKNVICFSFKNNFI